MTDELTQKASHERIFRNTHLPELKSNTILKSFWAKWDKIWDIKEKKSGKTETVPGRTLWKNDCGF